MLDFHYMAGRDASGPFLVCDREGGRRNGGWVPTGCRSFAAAGCVSLRAFGGSGHFVLSFSGFRAKHALVLRDLSEKWTKPVSCPNGKRPCSCKSLIFRHMRRFLCGIFRQGKLIFRQVKLSCFVYFPTCAMSFACRPTSKVIPNTYSYYVL